MTAIATENVNVTIPATNDTWSAEMAQLRARYKSVREPILAALNLLLQDPNISDDDAKARAQMRGVRVTAASINGARNLLAKRVATATAPMATDTPAAETASAAKERAPRRVRAADAEVDTEMLIRQVVGKIQNQNNVEADRLRDAVRKAIAVLQSAVA